MNKSNLLERLQRISSSRGLTSVNDQAVHSAFLDICSYPGKSFVMALRQNGSRVFPLSIGLNPAEFLLWIETVDEREDRVELFSIDSELVAIEKVNLAEVEKLVFQLPHCDFSSVAALVKCVRQVLVEGIERNLWSSSCYKAPTFDCDQWPQWLDYFVQSKNVVMHSFLRKAIEEATKRVKVA